ncbi:uncharacterized protein F5891DRAFT_1196451 [Suillus fuscotomentosus]|uniref:Uncharacterized protein n=1 Tax=Suillus fuscotomentosus TaxID=1912939 RepID=A0AAD4DT17_9AGAM|nr:uncharacterized protein F5891DRAFT_1196451 [Suillus fuscotomentosus]KAG1893406.1 hypothetical protein F5891DRAFT_1196451 [Suillus fuscotomentosus]
MFLARDAGNRSIPAPGRMVMQMPDHNPHSGISGELQDITSESFENDYDNQYNGFRSGTSLNDDEDPLERFLRMTDHHHMMNTGDLLSNSRKPSPGPSSTNDPSTSSTVDSIQPLIPSSAQFDTFYPLPFPQSFVGSSQRSERHRHARTSSTMPYFIPGPRAVPPPEPTMAALGPVQPAVTVPHTTHTAHLAPVLPPEPMAMQPAIMPVMPVEPVTSQSTSNTVPAAMQPAGPGPIILDVTPQVKKQIVEQEFTDDTGAALVSVAISEAASIPGLNATIKTTSSQRQQIMVAWNNIFRKLLAIVRSCLALGYNLYPPVGSNVAPDQFRGRVIAVLINDSANPLAFMHRFTVDIDGNIVLLDGILDNPLIFHITVHFIWCSDLSIYEFLAAMTSDRLQQVNYAISAVGSVVKLVLREQLPHPLVVIPFTQLEGKDTFSDIICYIDGLDDVQKLIFDHSKSHMLNVGDSQLRSTNVLARLDMMMTGVMVL